MESDSERSDASRRTPELPCRIARRLVRKRQLVRLEYISTPPRGGRSHVPAGLFVRRPSGFNQNVCAPPQLREQIKGMMGTTASRLKGATAAQIKASRDGC